MSYSTLDGRKTLREVIGTSWWTEEEGSIYTINVADKNGDTVRIPMRLSEEYRTETLTELPAIVMHMAMTNYTPWDIAATTRRIEERIDLDIIFTNTDNIDSSSFGKTVIDAVYNQIRSKQCTTFAATYNWFINIENIRIPEEVKAHQVVFHISMEILIRYYTKD